MDPQLLAAIPGALVALAALAVSFVRSEADKSVAEGVQKVHAKLDTLGAELGAMRTDLGVSHEHMAGEVGKLDIRLSHIERRVPMQRDPFRPAHEGA